MVFIFMPPLYLWKNKKIDYYNHLKNWDEIVPFILGIWNITTKKRETLKSTTRAFVATSKQQFVLTHFRLLIFCAERFQMMQEQLQRYVFKTLFRSSIIKILELKILRDGLKDLEEMSNILLEQKSERKNLLILGNKLRVKTFQCNKLKIIKILQYNILRLLQLTLYATGSPGPHSFCSISY